MALARPGPPWCSMNRHFIVGALKPAPDRAAQSRGITNDMVRSPIARQSLGARGYSGDEMHRSAVIRQIFSITPGFLCGT